MLNSGYTSLEGDKDSSPIFQEFRVYIEGVQVPFADISISSVYGSLPTAQVIVPYLPYLQEIARNYRPKIHIFYADATNTLSNYKQDKEDIKEARDLALKVLFSGEIVASNYSKSKTPFSSSSNLTFSCVHKNSAVQEMAMRLASFSAQEGSRQASANQAQANATVTLTNPGLLATQVIQGIDTKAVFDLSEGQANPAGVPTYLDLYKPYYKGMPGVLLRLWNIICTDANVHSNINDIMQRLYIPLFINLKFFDGITSHTLVEEFLEKKRAPIDAADMTQLGDAGVQTGSSPGTALSPLKASYDPLGTFIASVQINSLSELISQNVSSLGFLDFVKSIYAEFFYEMITLNSPVQRFNTARSAELAKAVDEYQKLEVYDSDPIAPGETIIKPVMPIYFSPKCNVLYPKMYTSISVNDMYAEAPTRVEVFMNNVGNVNLPINMTFRSPPSLRDAFLARAFPSASGQKITDPIDTFSIVGNTIGVTEIARGVKSRAVDAPSWMTHIASKSDDGTVKEGFKEILTQYADYEYSIGVTSTRTGTVQSIFNPYIIAGYPMDIIDPGLYRPSYHAFCTSVTHSISSAGVAETSIGFTNAITYDELYGVDTPLALPWLAEVLGMQEGVSQETAKVSYSKLTSLTDADQAIIDAANTYYSQVLGVGAAFPDVLTGYKYFTPGEIPPTVFQKQVEETISTTSSPEESILLCRRPIQTKTNVAGLHDLKFIDTDTSEFQPVGALASSVAFHSPTGNKEDISFSLTRNGKLANGFNAFLDYDAFKVTPDTEARYTQAPVSTTGSNSAPVASTGNDPTGVNSNSRFEVKNGWPAAFAKFQAQYPTVAAYVNDRENALRAAFSDYPPNLFKQLLFVESSYNPNAQSSVAFGLGQLVPKFFFNKNPKAFEKSIPGYIENVKESARHLAYLKRQFKTFTWSDATVAYNQGEGTVLKAKKKGGGVARFADCTLDSGGDKYFIKVFDTSKPRVS